MFQAVCPRCQIYTPSFELFPFEVKLCAPILISIQKCREHAVQVCASANEEQYHEEQRLELEDAELDDNVVSK
jgi:hypothetical protein